MLAAGRCRAELNGVVYVLDEPRLVGPGDEAVRELPIGVLGRFLSIDYLALRVVSSAPGSLDEPPEAESATVG